MSNYPNPVAAPRDIDRPGAMRHIALGRIMHFESLMARRRGEPREMRYRRLYNYYTNQNLPPDNTDQPLAINFFKTIIDKHVNYLFGQFKDHVIEWRITPRNREDLDASELDDLNRIGRKIKRFLKGMYEASQMDAVLWSGAKNGGTYGDTIFKLRYDPVTRRIVVESVLPEYFHCMWNVSDMNQITECIVAWPIDRTLAWETYGCSGNDQFAGYNLVNPDYMPGVGVYWERWSSAAFQIWIDDFNAVNIPNPYTLKNAQGHLYPGLLPFIHIPNMPTGADFWGFGDGEDMLLMQDELNRRVADIGDIVNTHAHPIITLMGFTGKVNTLTIGPDTLWDLGADGKAERLAGMGVDTGTMTYIEKIMEMIRDTASMPEAAFGSRKGGGAHQSGLALSMAMMPVIERAREKRIRWKHAMEKLARMAFLMLYVQDPGMLTYAGFSYEDTFQFDIEAIFSDFLPKERLEDVNEMVARSANMLVSIPTALEKLGEDDVASEVERIKDDAQFKASIAQPLPGASGGTAGKNSEQGLGGAAGIPGAIGAGLNKPGAQIKSPEIDQMDSVSMSNQAG